MYLNYGESTTTHISIYYMTMNYHESNEDIIYL